VLRSGGWLQVADIVVRTLPSDACRAHPELWAECVVGATTAESYLTWLGEAGLVEAEVLSRHDYFAHSASAETRRVAESFGAHAALFRARKP
jgi:uncharacterized phage protein gp47/JayE